jgi:hypothetical protein
LVPRTTPIESPQSNGMAEAFVKTFKRDYLRVNPRPDAASLLHRHDNWFEHYNAVHAYKALGYRSPSEFRKQMMEKMTTEDAVGAARRPHEGAMSTEAIGSSLALCATALRAAAIMEQRDCFINVPAAPHSRRQTPQIQDKPFRTPSCHRPQP